MRGASDAPVYIWISDDECQIRDASHVWGQDTFSTDEALRSETDEEAVTAVIGQAGEQGVMYASIMTDSKDARAAGRCGVGTVMGAKRVKGLAARGTGSGNIPSDAQALSSHLRSITRDIVSKASALRNYGTVGSMAAIEAVGDLPTRIGARVVGRWSRGNIRSATCRYAPYR